MTIREALEEREVKTLSRFGTLSRKTRGRAVTEEECDIRTAFQRDRDRILHSKAFRRLKQKTQVFLQPMGDHYRTRLTHTLEVSQNARTIAKALGLNEDLTEAIALGHDLGHTPFGHAGEKALNEKNPSGFHHNEQSLRVVEVLEKQGEGLNLTWEVRDGILNHRTSGRPATPEGQIVRLSDKIAYLHHDIDDAVRGGILTEQDLPGECRALLGESTRIRLDTMVHDVIVTSMDRPEIRMSEEIEAAVRDLRKFLFSHVYMNSRAKAEEHKAIQMICHLYDFYMENRKLIPEQYERGMRNGTDRDETVVCDYIAGMTDTYAVEKYRELFIPESWKY